MSEQLHICYFIEKSCLQNHHQKCDEVWQGASIKAICKCRCHEKKEKLLTSQSKAAEQGRQSKLENFGELDCIET